MSRQSNRPNFSHNDDRASSEGRGEMWSDVALHLRAVPLPELDVEAQARIWKNVETKVHAPVTRPLRAIELPKANAATSLRMWQRLARARARLNRAPRMRSIITPRPAMNWQMALSAAVVLILLLGAMNTLAAAALPGEALYPVKLTTEALRLQFISSPTTRAQAELELADKRRVEAEQLVARGAPPMLVAQTLSDSLNHLSRAATILPATEIAPRLREWQRDVDQWDSVYRATTNALLTDWLDAHPALAPLPAPPNATPAPGVNPTATAMPLAAPSSTPVGLVSLPVSGTSVDGATNGSVSLPALPPSPSTSVPAPTARPPNPAPSIAPTRAPATIVPEVAPTQIRPTVAPTLRAATVVPPTRTPLTVVPTLPKPTAAATLTLPALPKPTGAPTLPLPTLPLP